MYTLFDIFEPIPLNPNIPLVPDIFQAALSVNNRADATIIRTAICFRSEPNSPHGRAKFEI
jgi:hypothetical protein